MYDSDGKWIDTMQVCRNGHVINDSYIKSPEFNQENCQKCGKETITECENCNKPIPGHIHYSNVVSLYFKTSAPDYCLNCQEPYPWNRGMKKGKRRIKSGFQHLKKFIEWSVEQIRKLKKG